MIEAIDFLRAWRDLCDERISCKGCPAERTCADNNLCGRQDEEITKLVGSVMSWKRQQERKKESGQT